MLRSGKWRVGWLGLEGDPISAYIKVLARNANDNILMFMVTTAGQLPSSVAGYAYGCMAIVSDSGAIYFNTGGTTTCTFTVVGLTNGIITTQYISDGTVTPIKMGVVVPYTYATYMATGASGLIAPSRLIGGYLKITSTQVNAIFNIHFPLATEIIAAFAGSTGYWFDCEIVNTTASTATFSAETGVTIRGSTSLAAGKAAHVRFIITGASTVDAVITIGS